MNLKLALILLTLVSVVADTMLLPFYPQFFSQAFGVDSPEHVGYYIAACCFTVMTAFPLWTKVAKKVNELHLWVYTQIAAAILGVACFYTTDLMMFWIVSQTMLIFKASYLLIYPFVLRLEEKDKHLGMIGLFSVLMHFGAIGGAVVGGVVLQIYAPQDVYLIMAASDILQVMVCLYIINRLNVPFAAEVMPISRDVKIKRPIGFVYKLSVISALFYFSAFMIRPFFSSYWEAISHIESEIIAGLVYSIPGWVALFALWLNHNAKKEHDNFKMICAAFTLGIAGLLLQGSQVMWIVILGRLIFGWAIFQITVRLEVMLFKMSEPSAYAIDFSKMHFFQNLGVIAASFSVGSLVSSTHFQMSFIVSSIGFAVTLLLFFYLFKAQASQAPQSELAIEKS